MPDARRFAGYGVNGRFSRGSGNGDAEIRISVRVVDVDATRDEPPRFKRSAEGVSDTRRLRGLVESEFLSAGGPHE